MFAGSQHRGLRHLGPRSGRHAADRAGGDRRLELLRGHGVFLAGRIDRLRGDRAQPGPGRREARSADRPLRRLLPQPEEDRQADERQRGDERPGERLPGGGRARYRARPRPRPPPARRDPRRHRRGGRPRQGRPAAGRPAGRPLLRLPVGAPDEPTWTTPSTR